jgi:hypothetical protein
MSDDNNNPYSLETSSSEAEGLNGSSALTYRALVIADVGYAEALTSGLKISDTDTETNLTVAVSASEPLTFKGLGTGMLKAVVQSSVPYTIARTAGHITVIFAYDSETIPGIELTGGLKDCNYYYADPTRDLIINKDGEGSGIKTQSGDKKSIPMSILTHLAAAAVGYAANSGNGGGVE